MLENSNNQFIILKIKNLCLGYYMTGNFFNFKFKLLHRAILYLYLNVINLFLIIYKIDSKHFCINWLVLIANSPCENNYLYLEYYVTSTIYSFLFK